MPRSVAMRASIDDNLLQRADAVIREADQLRLALMRQRSIAQAICADRAQARTLQAGLLTAVAIALTVTAPRSA